MPVVLQQTLLEKKKTYQMCFQLFPVRCKQAHNFQQAKQTFNQKNHHLMLAGSRNCCTRMMPEDKDGRVARACSKHCEDMVATAVTSNNDKLQESERWQSKELGDPTCHVCSHIHTIQSSYTCRQTNLQITLILVFLIKDRSRI